MKPGRLQSLFIVAMMLWNGAISGALDPIQQGYAAFERKQWRDAYEYWVPEADKGDARAQYYLSILFSKGLGVEQSQETALTFLTLSAEGGFPPAQYHLGNNFQHGEWIEQDSERALFWWKQAAEQQFITAQLKMGAIYYLGRGVDKDLDKATEWYRQAAKNGSPQAVETLTRLGVTDIEQPRAAVFSFSTAAEIHQAVVSPAAMNTVIFDEPAKFAMESGDNKNKILPVQLSYRLQDQLISAKDAAVRESALVAIKELSASSGPRTSVTVDGQDDMEWIAHQPAENFTLQLFSSDKQESAERVARTLKSDWRVILFPFGRYGYRWYGVLAGSFETMAQATQARQVLVEQNKLETPWIRRFRSITKRDD